MRLGLNAGTSLSRQARQHLQSLAATTKDATFRLPSGRVLGYAEYGNPSGTPLFVLHGFPSSRLEAGPLAAIARSLDIRVIALDRPGFGLSTPQPGRTILDFTTDMGDFARAMHIPRFAVGGFSGGGPYALACAYAFPRSTLGAVGLFASGPPWVSAADADDGVGTVRMMSWPRRVMRIMALHWPSGLRVLLNGVMGTLRWLSGTGVVVRKTEEWLAAQDRERERHPTGKDSDANEPAGSLTEGQKSSVSDRRVALLRILDEPFRQGSWATVQETKPLTEPTWGFPFESVPHHSDRPVRIWHGAKDVNAPIGAIRYLAERVPGAVLTEYPDDTHYTMGLRFEGALRELVEDFKRKG
ncbi:Alpha/Beta hydrolase protein [Microdochium bolleyi]|uniref:Alpha/Beta hydrolase protein n=1 Tax=Microdochium bolleyi TaxID=196109 RepID=A0A136IPW4_9PEZI|nr:Alpha/Beta hydrolase protein [Microdochium bolleyi]